MKGGAQTEFLDRARLLLTEAGISMPDSAVDRLERHVSLVRDFNRVVGVVSRAEVDHLWERHVVDALSLAPLVRRYAGKGASLLDIGSGGGFPALPLKVVLPDLQVTLLERAEGKIGFLRKAVAVLGLEDVLILHGTFPAAVAGMTPSVITARAVERPEGLQKDILSFIAKGAVYMCQSSVNFGDDVEVLPVNDGWSDAGLRRGTLRVVRRRDSS